MRIARSAWQVPVPPRHPRAVRMHTSSTATNCVRQSSPRTHDSSHHSSNRRRNRSGEAPKSHGPDDKGPDGVPLLFEALRAVSFFRANPRSNPNRSRQFPRNARHPHSVSQSLKPSILSELSSLGSEVPDAVSAWHYMRTTPYTGFAPPLHARTNSKVCTKQGVSLGTRFGTTSSVRSQPRLYQPQSQDPYQTRTCWPPANPPLHSGLARRVAR